MHPLDDKLSARLMRLSYHEAGHVVALRHFRIPILLAWISDTEGEVRPSQIPSASIDDESLDWAVAVIGMAGREAQGRINFATRDLGYNECDECNVWRRIVKLQNRLSRSESDIAAEIERRTEKLVSEYLPHVEIVARSLRERRRLAGDEIERLLEARI